MKKGIRKGYVHNLDISQKRVQKYCFFGHIACLPHAAVYLFRSFKSFAGLTIWELRVLTSIQTSTDAPEFSKLNSSLKNIQILNAFHVVSLPKPNTITPAFFAYPLSL